MLQQIQLTWSIVPRRVIMNGFTKYLEDLEGSWREGSVIWPADELRKSQSWKIVWTWCHTHTHRHTEIVHTDITHVTLIKHEFCKIPWGPPPLPPFLHSCCLPFDLHHITSLSVCSAYFIYLHILYTCSMQILKSINSTSWNQSVNLTAAYLHKINTVTFLGWHCLSLIQPQRLALLLCRAGC